MRRCTSLTMVSDTQTTPPLTGVWPPSDQPLIVIELAREEYPMLRPGFGRWDDDDAFVIDRHPSAGVRLRERMAHLWLDDRTFEPVRVPIWWHGAATAILAVIPADTGVAADATDTDRFRAAIDAHTALLAEIPIEVQAT